MKKAIALLIMIILVFSTCSCMAGTQNSNPDQEKEDNDVELNVDIDEDKLAKIELSTISSTVHLTCEGNKKTSVLWGAIKTGDYKVFFEYDAVIEVGVEIKDVTVDSDKKLVKVTLSKPMLLDATMDENSINLYPYYVINKNGILQNEEKLTAEDLIEMRGKAQTELVEKVTSKEVNFKLALENAKTIMENYVSILTSGTYKVKFVDDNN